MADRIGDDLVLALRAIREALMIPDASISTNGNELAASGTVVTQTHRAAEIGGTIEIRRTRTGH